MATAKRSIRVPVTTEQYDRIQSNADAVGLGLAGYLRQVGIGYTPSSVVDQDKVDTLHQAMANLGRLGGLLKLWLTDDEKLAAYPEARMRKAIPDTLQQIRRNQATLLEIIKALKD